MGRANQVWVLSLPDVVAICVLVRWPLSASSLESLTPHLSSAEDE